MELFTAVAIGAPCNTRTVAGAFLGRTVRSFVTPERTLRFGRFGRCSCTTVPSEAEAVSPEEGVLLWPPRVPAGAGTSRFLCDAFSVTLRALRARVVMLRPAGCPAQARQLVRGPRHFQL